MQPIYLVVKPDVILPRSIYERDDLTALTDLSRTQSRIFLDSFEGRMTALSMFHFTFAVHINMFENADLERYLTFTGNNSIASETYFFVSANLKDLFLFMTGSMAGASLTVCKFMNYVYQTVDSMFPDLLSDYTVVPQKDGSFILEKE